MNINLCCHLLDPLTCTTFTTMTMAMIMDCSSLQHQVLFMYAYHHSSTKYLHSLHCTKAISIYQWKGKRSKCASFKGPYIFTLWYNYKIRIFQSVYLFSYNWQPLHTVNSKYHSAGIKWSSVDANEDLQSSKLHGEAEDQKINLFFLLCTLDYGKVLGSPCWLSSHQEMKKMHLWSFLYEL